ncbi:MAG: histidine kinase [Ginsengibacter sp.]
MQSDLISTIFEDSKKRLWIGNSLGGVYLLDRISRKFYTYNLQTDQVPKIDGVWKITEDKEGGIWVAGHEGYFKLDEKRNVFLFYNDVLGIKKGVNTSILYVDEENNIWLSTSEGVKMYSQTEKRLFDNSYNPQHLPIFDFKQFASAIIRNQDTLWAVFEKHIERYIFSSNKLKRYYFSANLKNTSKPRDGDQSVRGAFRFENGNIIIPILSKGLSVYDPLADSFFFVRANNTSSFSYHDDENSEESVEIAEDKNGNIIIGNSSGLNVTNPSKQLFFNNHGSKVNSEKFPHVVVSDFLQVPSGDIFIAYYAPNAGIVQADSNLLFKKKFSIPLINDDQGINQVWLLFLQQNNTLIAPNQVGRSLKIDIDKSTIEKNSDTLISGPINTIQEDGDDIWLGTWRNGLQKINRKNKTKKLYDSYINKDNKFANRVFSLLLQDDKIWVGTMEYGLVLMDKFTGKTIAIYKKNREVPNGISSNFVNDIIDYHNDTLVIATEMGLNIFDKRTKKFTTITTREGLPNNFVLRLIKDDFGNVWATCGSGGFCKIDMHTLAVKTFSAEDGILDNAFNGIIYSLKNKTILVGNSSGFMSFNPANFNKISPSPSPGITGIYLYNKWLPIHLENKDQTLEFAYNQNFLRIEFSILRILKEAGTKIYFRLNGIDKSWVLADKNNSSVYSNLTNGHYIFEVKGINRDGIESKITSLNITVKPPYYKTWWFLCLAGGTLLLLTILLVKRREKNIMATEEKKLQIQKLKADQYRSRMELEEIINFFSSSLVDKNSVDDVLWDVANNLIGTLGFEDCIIYMWNPAKTKLVQKAGFEVQDSPEKIKTMHMEVLPGQGIVGHVINTREPLIVHDTSLDNRYRADNEVRYSEITVPILHNGELLGVVDSEHREKNFFTPQHLQVLITVATLVSNKIISIEAQQVLQKQKLELHYINEQLYKTKLEALRSQMNPHFIFNSLNAIQECILTGKVDSAYQYLSKFSKLQRMVLNNSEKELIPLKKEIEMLELYLELESLRFSKSFSYEIIAGGNMLDDEVMIPSMITQPFVENALWHGLRNTQEEKILKIIYAEHDEKFTITVSDNGIGRAAAEKIKKEKLGMDQHESRGTILMQNRLSILERQLNVEIDLEIIDELNNDGSPAGTTVKLTFPAHL